MKILKQLIFLFLLYIFADLMTSYLGLPLPSTLVSMLFLIILLMAGVVKEKWIDEGSKLLLKILPVLFIPAGVRILEYLSLLQENAKAFAVILTVTTILTFMTTLWSVNLLSRKGKSYGNHSK